MKVLVACEESQAVCKAFRERGHEAYSCDIIECSGGHPEWHIQADALELLKIKWDLIIAHPPCDYMSKAGARWMFANGKVNQDRLQKAMESKKFFMQFYNADCDKIVIENPTPLKIVGLPKETQVIQPYMFGEPYSKRTLLWIKGLEPLKPTNVLTEYKPWMPSNTGSFSRGGGGSNGVAHNKKMAARTFDGIAAAMAEQWG